MNKKTNEKNEVLTIGELSEVSGTKQTTIKYYTEIGILPFCQDGERLARKYKKMQHQKDLKKLLSILRVC